ncbi:hypothetical protein BWQ96_10575 [Gracilariopsis chorda]|uniref:Uncharacterized protein n=1 Tax=Gracilariopsis chorda TaxID=448386 RepID=A0A2V3ICA8_9FLOR|nr:hypothetical protein BWQ96_10575 [Gracilariopsis chorda]|eukprot:PXF39723.1 hypothetical protein BWQ96_10575 [Gracilariopsis chorda]
MATSELPAFSHNELHGSMQKLMRRHERAIKQTGDVNAMLSLAELLQKNPDGSNEDRSRAYQLLCRAAKQHPTARTLNALATAQLAIRPTPAAVQPRAVTQQILEHSLHVQETPDACCDSAWLLYNGHGNGEFKDDPDRAVQLLERAVRRSRSVPPHCLPQLAYLLSSNQVSHPDPLRAVRLYKEFVGQERCPMAMTNLAILYHFGKPPLKPSLSHARKWYKRALQHATIPVALLNLADILSASSNAADIVHAAQLLEKLISIVPSERAMTSLASLYHFRPSVLNISRAVRLYRQVIRQFDSTRARLSVSMILLSGRSGVAPNPCEAFRHCREVYNRTKKPSLLPLLAQIYWSGTASEAPDRALAVNLALEAKQTIPNANVLLAHMLRYGHSLLLKRCLNEAIRLLEKCDNVVESVALAVVLSEHHNPYTLLLRRVFSMLKEGTALHDDVYWLVWLPLHLRRSNAVLPVCGCPHRITHAVMKMERLRTVSVLNLSSLLLENHKIQPENCDSQTALSLLESGVKKDNSDLIRINLAYVLWYGVSGVKKDSSRAIHLVEGVILRSSHQLARNFVSVYACRRT